MPSFKWLSIGLISKVDLDALHFESFSIYERLSTASLLSILGSSFLNTGVYSVRFLPYEMLGGKIETGFGRKREPLLKA